MKDLGEGERTKGIRSAIHAPMRPTPLPALPPRPLVPPPRPVAPHHPPTPSLTVPIWGHSIISASGGRFWAPGPLTNNSERKTGPREVVQTSRGSLLLLPSPFTDIQRFEQIGATDFGHFFMFGLWRPLLGSGTVEQQLRTNKLP